eukprot:6508318-Prymnesium_polylepis.1
MKRVGEDRADVGRFLVPTHVSLALRLPRPSLPPSAWASSLLWICKCAGSRYGMSPPSVQGLAVTVARRRLASLFARSMMSVPDVYSLHEPI